MEGYQIEYECGGARTVLPVVFSDKESAQANAAELSRAGIRVLSIVLSPGGDARAKIAIARQPKPMAAVPTLTASRPSSATIAS